MGRPLSERFPYRANLQAGFRIGKQASGEGELRVALRVSPHHDRRQSNPAKRDDRPARVLVHPDRHPHNSVVAREEITIDSFERPTVASFRIRGASLRELN